VLRKLGDAAEGRWEIVQVVAQPDKPVGRGLALQPPPVKVEAQLRGWPVIQPVRAREAGFVERVRELAPDVIVVAAYGQILPPSLLAIPRCGCLNVHTSVLPRWRGAAPIQWAILAGDAETGVTLMRMDAGLDTGDIVAVERTPIGAGDTGQTLHDRLALLGGALLVRVLPDWLAGRMESRRQPEEGVTYARKLAREDGRLDWGETARGAGAAGACVQSVAGGVHRTWGARRSHELAEDLGGRGSRRERPSPGA
jgi:methionyl-tRNA formyltransferase